MGYLTSGTVRSVVNLRKMEKKNVERSEPPGREKCSQSYVE